LQLVLEYVAPLVASDDQDDMPVLHLIEKLPGVASDFAYD
jgi:hypothetical protein